MKNLHFALCSLFILLCIITACSLDNDSKEQTVIEDDAEADKGPPLTNEENPSGEKPPVDDPSDGDPSKDVSNDDSSNGDPSKDDPSNDDPSNNDSSKVSSKIPDLLINEMRTEYRQSVLRAEYIEFKMLSAGNLGGLRVFVASNTQNPLIYEFLPVEVKEGEYVVLHLRTLEDSSRDEYGDDLSESGGRDSSPTARDFWIPGSSKLLRRTDAVYVMDKDDKILDAVMIADNIIPPNSVAFFTQAAEFLFNHGAWMSADGTLPGHDDAVRTSSIGAAMTRSISRDETAPDTNTAADWYITPDNGITPGTENDPRRL